MTRTRRARLEIAACIAAVAAVAVAVTLWALLRPRTQCAVFLAAEQVDTARVSELFEEAGMLRNSVSYCAPEAPEYAFRFAAMRETGCDLYVLREEEFSLLDASARFFDLAAYAGGEECYGIPLPTECALQTTFVGEGTYYLCVSNQSRYARGEGLDEALARVLQVFLSEGTSGTSR